MEGDRSSHTAPGVLRLLARAVQVGERTGAFCAALHAQQGDLAARHTQVTLSFLKKYGAARLEQACTTAQPVEQGTRARQDYAERRHLHRRLRPLNRPTRARYSVRLPT